MHFARQLMYHLCTHSGLFCWLCPFKHQIRNSGCATISKVTLDVTKDVTLELLKSDLNETEKMVYQLLLNRPKATKEEISATMGKTTRTIQRALNSLSEKKFILRIGGKRFGYWEILK